MRRLLLPPLLLAATPAWADRDYCPDRPGFTTPACTIEPGRVSAEVAAVDWTRDTDGDEQEDELLAGDLLLRTGIGATTEVALGWTAFGHHRERDIGGVETMDGVGDVTLALKQNLLSPDGSGTALAAVVEALLPIGSEAIGAGDWGVRLLVPASAELNDAVAVTITPEVDAAPDEDRAGRHLRYGSAAGFAFQIGEAASVQTETLWLRDDDPADRHSEWQAGLFLAEMIGEDWQVDAGGAVGLNRDAPDLNLSFGVSHRF